MCDDNNEVHYNPKKTVSPYEAIDLGLSVKWADMNVGAISPEDFGDYFMWGSTTPDTDNVCDWAHAPFNNGATAFNETYFNEHKSEWLDGDVLKPEYDAAHVIMGGSWRMPTKAETQELVDGTTQSVETRNGISGMRFTSTANGNSVFMPFAGYRDGSKVLSVENYGCAWSSSLDADFGYWSYGFYFSNIGRAYPNTTNHRDGFVVRGVC